MGSAAGAHLHPAWRPGRTCTPWWEEQGCKGEKQWEEKEGKILRDEKRGISMQTV